MSIVPSKPNDPKEMTGDAVRRGTGCGGLMPADLGMWFCAAAPRMKAIPVLLLMAVVSAAGGPLTRYKHRTLIDVSNGLHHHYTGPLMAAGGWLVEYEGIAVEDTPFRTGGVTRNSIALFDDEVLRLYPFKWVRCYRVEHEGEQYNIYYMRGRGAARGLRLIVELREQGYWDRTLYIFDGNRLITVVFWIDTLRVKPPKTAGRTTETLAYRIYP